MRQRLLALAVGAVLLCGSRVGADTLTYDFSNPTGTLSTSQTYTVDGVTITARGYSGINSPNSVGTPTNLFGKAEGWDETGLGIDNILNHEIKDSYFIQLDLTGMVNQLHVTSAKLQMSSVQEDESYDIYGSNTLGVPGTKLISDGTLDQTFFDIPNFGSYTYISVAASSHDVLLSGAAIQGCPVAPEPNTLLLTAVGLGSLVTWLRKSRRMKG
jgi:hypothetical protein